ncbi:MAG: FtsH protease activity modulator HflK [Nitrospinota bacterium]
MDWDEFRNRRSSGRGGGSSFQVPNIKLPNLRGKGIWYGVAAVVVIVLLSGIYQVGPDEKGVVMRFGRVVRRASPGFNYRLPFFETVERPKVLESKREEIGFRTLDPGPPARYADRPQESLMLTGDENIVDVDMIIQYVISDEYKYLFAVKDPRGTVRDAAEAALREVIGSKVIDEALTTGKPQIQVETMALIQKILDSYDSGIHVTAVQLQDVHPPKEVSAAFIDVASAKEDKNRIVREADGYRNAVIPETRGKAAQVINRAEAYRAEKIRMATGDANRFKQVLKEYLKAKDVTRKRLYLETMEEILPGITKIILDQEKSGVLPILPLGEGAGKTIPGMKGTR